VSTSERLYRKVALERLSSPDQLDQLAQVTDGRGWLGLLTTLFLTVTFLIWGFLGAIPTSVEANGILLQRGGQVVTAMAPAQGILAGVDVSIGDHVTAGQVLARMERVDLAQEIVNLRGRLADQEATQRRRVQALENEARQQITNLRLRQSALEQNLEAARQNAEHQATKLELLETYAARGLISAQALQDTRVDASRARERVADLQVGLAELDGQVIDLELRQERERSALELERANLERQIQALQVRLDSETVVRAPAAGRIIEIAMQPGTVIATAQSIMSLETSGDGLQALVYIATEDGKRVHPGMTARIEPATVRKEEYGMLLARVIEVSEFPVTSEAMNAVLRNDQLNAAFLGRGAPYAARLELERADGTVSGYRWTSREGPPQELSSGTILSAKLTVREQRPISLIIPLLRKATGIDEL